MGKKIALFAFNGELMCFAHALINALDLKEQGHDVKLIIEGSATRLIEELGEGSSYFAKLYKRCIIQGIMDCVCRACAQKMGTLPSAESQGLPLCAEISGHPAMSRYIAEGYSIITF